MLTARALKNLRDRPGHLVRRLHQIHVALFLEESAAYALTPVQFGVLDALRDGRALDQVTIAAQVGIDRNNAADVIRRLEQRGLLLRPTGTEDRRTKLAQITEEGMRMVDAVFPLMVRAQQRFVEPLDEAEYAEFLRLMAKLVVENNEAGRAPWTIGGRGRRAAGDKAV